MTKLIVSGLCALVAGGMAIVMQGMGLQGGVVTWAVMGGIFGLVLSFIFGL